jgi:hypothetical protein
LHVTALVRNEMDEDWLADNAICEAVGLEEHLPVLPNLKPSPLKITLRLPQHLLDSIKTAANAREVRCQSSIKVWPQEKPQGS